MSASVVGFYSLPFFKRLRPVPHDTSMVKIIGNCVVLLVLSSALPILSRMLGKFFIFTSCLPLVQKLVSLFLYVVKQKTWFFMLSPFLMQF